ncbi:hypothetical protein MBH78_21065 [Oceanimonas sp. NS1]|nr:hypothetical protein [Oceanimonas sp. NS1]
MSSAAGKGLDTSPGKGRATLKAFPALSLPVIILGGIYGGVFTPPRRRRSRLFRP